MGATPILQLLAPTISLTIQYCVSEKEDRAPWGIETIPWGLGECGSKVCW